MTDNGSAYSSRLFVTRLAARHIRTRPYTPKTNGKAECDIQNLIWEWTYGIRYQTPDLRNADVHR